MTYNTGIMQFIRPAILGLCAFGLAFGAKAEQRGMDAYKSIVDRNPFGLKDPPPAVVKDAPKTNEVKKEDFYLTGISTIGNPNRPKVYLISKDPQKKQYDEKYFNLTLGDRNGDLMLNEVDVKGRRVRITYLGEEKWLSMKDNGVPAPAGPAPGAPGVPTLPPGSIVPPPGGNAPIPLPNAHNPSIPQPQPLSYPNANNANRRAIRTSNTGANQNTGYSGYGGVSGAVPNVPTTTAGGSGTYAGPQTDAEMLQHIINLQNPTRSNPSLPKNVPPPPIPQIGNMPGL